VSEPPALFASVAPQPARWRLQMPWRVRIFAVLLLVIPAFFVAVYVGASPRDRDGLRQTLYIALAIVPAVPYMLLTSRGWVDETGIEARLRRLARVRLPWARVGSIKWNGAHFVVRDADGRLVVAWKNGVTNIDAFARLALAHAPAAAIDDATRDVLEERATGMRPPRGAIVFVAEDDGAATPDACARWRDNPFHVLALSPECSSLEVERAGQKLLGLLAVGVASAQSYPTPFGAAPRTPEKVRAAMAELRDPDRRIAHEVWARIPEGAGADGDATTDPTGRGWPDAMRAVGWRAL
jgi:hypothetical protein